MQDNYYYIGDYEIFRGIPLLISIIKENKNIAIRYSFLKGFEGHFANLKDKFDSQIKDFNDFIGIKEIFFDINGYYDTHFNLCNKKEKTIKNKKFVCYEYYNSSIEDIMLEED